MVEPVKIDELYITLGKLLKHTGVIQTGGSAKWYLSEHLVYVNDEEESRRGKKLYEGDKVTIPDIGDFVVTR